jgi:predicted dehydrogenase
MINVGLIGFGYWGPNLARNFNVNPDLELAAICDFSAERLKTAGRFYPQATLYDTVEDFFKNTDLDVIAVSTPVASHYGLAKSALDSGRHVWVEKPMTETVAHRPRNSLNWPTGRTGSCWWITPLFIPVP